MGASTVLLLLSVPLWAIVFTNNNKHSKNNNNIYIICYN